MKMKLWWVLLVEYVIIGVAVTARALIYKEIVTNGIMLGLVGFAGAIAIFAVYLVERKAPEESMSEIDKLLKANHAPKQESQQYKDVNTKEMDDFIVDQYNSGVDLQMIAGALINANKMPEDLVVSHINMLIAEGRVVIKQQPQLQPQPVKQQICPAPQKQEDSQLLKEVKKAETAEERREKKLVEWVESNMDKSGKKNILKAMTNKYGKEYTDDFIFRHFPQLFPDEEEEEMPLIEEEHEEEEGEQLEEEQKAEQQEEEIEEEPEPKPKKEIPREGSFKCYKCGYIARTEGILRNHIRLSDKWKKTKGHRR